MPPAKGQEEQIDEIAAMLGQVDRVIQDLIRYKKVIEESLNAFNGKISELETKLSRIEARPAGVAAAPIDEETLGKIKENTKDLEMLATIADELNKKITEWDKMFLVANTETMQIQDGFAKALDRIEQKAEKAHKLANEDNKFMEGMHHELKDHIKETDSRIREMDKEITKAGRLKEAIREVIKLVGE
jgi:chromosome segregation ATPase